MTVDNSHDDVPDADARRGLSRREMIAAAGAAGFTAWTAPVIIDSLSSPAAAATLTGTRCYQYNAGSGACAPVTPITGTCAPGSAAAPTSPWPCTNPFNPGVFTVNCVNSPGVIGTCGQLVASFTIGAATSCTFIAAGGEKTNTICRTLFNDVCTNGTSGNIIQITGGGKILSYYSCPTLGICDQPWAYFTFVLSCT
jgi:hypothetical protein